MTPDSMLHQQIVPWLVPFAAPELRLLCEQHGRIETFSLRTVIQSDREPYRYVRFVRSGIVSQGVTDDRLNKPMAHNLYPAGSIMGFLNLYTGVTAPRRLTAVTRCEVVSVERELILRHITSDKDLLLLFSQYCELAAKSELIGMEALFMLSLPERLMLWCAASLLHGGINPHDSDEEYLKLPVNVSRAVLGNIIYVSRTPLDKLLAVCAREGTIVRDGSARLVRRESVLPMVDWIRFR